MTRFQRKAGTVVVEAGVPPRALVVARIARVAKLAAMTALPVVARMARRARGVDPVAVQAAGMAGVAARFTVPPPQRELGVPVVPERDRAPAPRRGAALATGTVPPLVRLVAIVAFVAADTGGRQHARHR